MISYDDFLKLELKVGTVLEVLEVKGSDKLLKLKVDLGEEKPRQVLAGIKQWYKPTNLVGKQLVVVANLEPRIMMGLESQGMILAADDNNKPVYLKPSSKVSAGAKIR